MATTGQEVEADTLTHLEDRIQKAVALVHRLRQELAASQTALEDSRGANATLTAELEGLQTERRQVRARLEKLLGHIDQLGAA